MPKVTVQHADKEFLCLLKPLKGINSLSKAGRKVEWEPFGTNYARLCYLNATLPSSTGLLGKDAARGSRPSDYFCAVRQVS